MKMMATFPTRTMTKMVSVTGGKGTSFNMSGSRLQCHMSYDERFVQLAVCNLRKFVLCVCLLFFSSIGVVMWTMTLWREIWTCRTSTHLTKSCDRICYKIPSCGAPTTHVYFVNSFPWHCFIFGHTRTGNVHRKHVQETCTGNIHRTKRRNTPSSFSTPRFS